MPQPFAATLTAPLRGTEESSDGVVRLQPHTFITLLTLKCLMISSIAFAGGKLYINTERDGVALRGYDAVAYFTLGKPTKGTRTLAFTWMDAKWYFASREHLELFKTNPEQYAPQYGGYCAWAVAHNYIWPADPLAWKIVEGKLYLNADKNVQAKWVKEIPELIEKGDKNWPAVLNR